MPSVTDEDFSQWSVVNTGFLMVRTNSGPTQWQWQIIARFIPDKTSIGLKMLDIQADVDGVSVPFTFDEESQLFESVTSTTLSPGSHRFELTPSENPSRSLPTLTIDFEMP